jgi:hypothetical protein
LHRKRSSFRETLLNTSRTPLTSRRSRAPQSSSSRSSGWSRDFSFKQEILPRLSKNYLDASKEHMAWQIEKIPEVNSFHITTGIRKGTPHEEKVANKEDTNERSMD